MARGQPPLMYGALYRELHASEFVETLQDVQAELIRDGLGNNCDPQNADCTDPKAREDKRSHESNQRRTRIGSWQGKSQLREIRTCDKT